jgi:hypothetical protein
MKQFEAMLAGWSNTHNGGVKVTLWLQDEEDLAYFEAATVRKGRTAGQRYQVVMVEIGDDEQPVPGSDKPLVKEQSVEPAVVKNEAIPEVAAVPAAAHPDEKPARKGNPNAHFPGGLCGLAVRWCADPHFRAWMQEEGLSLARDEAGVRQAILENCGITSRKELDTVQAAGNAFNEFIRAPYSAARKEAGIE